MTAENSESSGNGVRRCFKFVAADLTTRYHTFSYLDALRRGEPIRAANPTEHADACPREPGDGLCVAYTVAAACSGGQCVSTSVGLVVEYAASDELARVDGKARVRALRVVDVFDPLHLIRLGLCANLRGANLRDADLQGADLRGADLQGAHLQGAHLQGAHLQGADLRGANLRDAHLQGAHLQGADLQGAHLRDANLRGADLQGAHLQGAHLRGANLQGANLQGADLQGADLRGANLRDANLQGAHLQGADLQGAHLRDANLRGATADGSTRWPDDFDVESSGVRVQP